MKSWQKPTPEIVAKTVSLLTRQGQVDYFFQRLENPEWVLPLSEKGLFKNPPGPIENLVERSNRHPVWEASRYLVRMARAGSPHAAEVALEIDSDNFWVRENVLEVLEASGTCPPHGHLKRYISWVSVHSGGKIPECLVAIARNCLSSGNLESFTKIFQGVFGLISLNDDSDADAPLIRRTKVPKAKFDEWSYKRLLNSTVPEVHQVLGVDGLNNYVRLLEDHAYIQRGKNGDWNGSSNWRASIEDTSQNIAEDLGDILVLGLRNYCNTLIDAKPELLMEVIGRLEGCTPPIFGRIALYLLTYYRNLAPAQQAIYERLANKTAFESFDLYHEYTVLALEAFDALTMDQQVSILERVIQDENPEEVRTSYRAWHSHEPSPEEIEERIAVRRKRALERFGSHLPEPFQAQQLALYERFGNSDHIEFLSYIGEATWGSTSPYSQSELADLPDDELLELLATWGPSSEWMGPSLEGLASEVARVFKADSKRLFRNLDKFLGLSPLYQAVCIETCRDLVTSDELDPTVWNAILNFVTRLNAFGTDNHRLARSLVDLLRVGWEKRKATIPIELRTLSFDIIRPYLDHSNPTRAEDERNRGGMDPLTQSLNTVRGAAFHALFAYCLWVKRSAGDAWGKSVSCPEAMYAIDRHVNADTDPSPSMRALFGQWFPWMVVIDRDWAKSQRPLVFDTDWTTESFRIAFESYLTRNRAYTDVFEVIRPVYEAAVGNLSIINLSDTATEHLGGHLLSLYWMGRIPLRESLLETFMRSASSSARLDAMEFLGRSVHSTTEELSSDVKERISSYVEWRIVEVDGKLDSRELTPLGWLLTSVKFEQDWSLDALRKAIRIAGDIEPTHLVFEMLLKQLPGRPGVVLEICSEFVGKSKNYWKISSLKDEIATIIRYCMECGSEQEIRSARDLIDRLGEMGFLTIRQLL